MSDPEGGGLLEAELRLRRDLTPSTLGKAVWQLVLGDPDGGLQTLRDWYTDAGAVPSGGYHRPALALLIGEADAAVRDARSELDQPTQNWVPGWREFRSSMLALVAADDPRSAREVAELEAYGATHPRLPSGPPSEVAKIPAGLFAGDAVRVDHGLDALLGWHLRSARSRTSDKFNSDTGVICLDAIVALLVAHRRGLGVRVDDRYRRAEVPLITVYLTEWQGQPVDHGTKLTLESDMIASPWLEAHGIRLPKLRAAPAVRGGRRTSKPASLGKIELDPSVVAEYLRRLVGDGRGTVWQLMSWSLMIGDHDAARRHLHAGLAEARRAWEETRPQRGGFLRRMWRSDELPNSNLVREHFALALAAGDEGALRETSGILRSWMDAVEEDGRRRGQAVVGHPYGHAAGYLDLLADLLQPTGAASVRAPVETVWAGFPTVRSACVALVRRDSALLERAVNDGLAEHARTLERRTSPPPALHAPAIVIAAAARRLGIQFETDPRYAAYPVPIIIRDPPGSPGQMGRLPCDLMGTALFAAG